MAHVLIVGMTESGKTHLARNLARHYKSKGIGVLVLDPLRDPEWNADFITDDQDAFLDVFWRSRRCMCFLDEGSESVGRYDLAMQKTATRGRHWGHACHYITQEAVQLAPVVRSQCSQVFLFVSSFRNGDRLAEDFNKPELTKCTDLALWEYLHAQRFGPTIHYRSNGNAVEIHTDDRGRGGGAVRSVDAFGRRKGEQGRQDARRAEAETEREGSASAEG